MSSAQPIRVTAMRGHIKLAQYGTGRKSELEAAFIETADARYLLRRKTGPVFNDTKLEYMGHEVDCDGFLVGKTLLAERIEVVD